MRAREHGRARQVLAFRNLFQGSQLTPLESVVTLWVAWQWAAKSRTDVPEVSPTPVAESALAVLWPSELRRLTNPAPARVPIVVPSLRLTGERTA